MTHLPMTSAAETPTRDCRQFPLATPNMYKGSCSYSADEDYAQKLHDAIIQGRACCFENDGPGKAISIVREFMSIAKKSAVIFCKSLSSDIYDNDGVLASFEKALKKGVHLRIIIQTPKMDEKCFRMKSILGKYHDKVKLQSACNDPDIKDWTFNACLIDGTYGRLETDPKQRKGKCYVGDRIACMVIEEILSKAFAGNLVDLQA